MEEKIESKMTEVVEYILTKPKETITADEYMILASELKDARFRREQAEQGDKFAKLLATVFPTFNGPDVNRRQKQQKQQRQTQTNLVKSDQFYQIHI